MKKRIRNLPFFDPDSKPMQVLGAFADMIVLNVCFLIGCLSAVTVGASMSALYAAMLRRQRGEGGGVFAEPSSKISTVLEGLETESSPWNCVLVDAAGSYGIFCV